MFRASVAIFFVNLRDLRVFVVKGVDMDNATRQKLIDQYKDGYRAVANALIGATDRDLDAHPAPGKWSAREIVHHLADSEMTSAIRFRLLLAQDNPHIVGYDQEEFARRLHYDRPTEASLVPERCVTKISFIIFATWGALPYFRR